MDFRQDKLSGFTAREFDGAGNLLSMKVVDFTTVPWTETVWETVGGMLVLMDQYHISKPTRDVPSVRLD